MIIRPVTAEDYDAVWPILEPVIRAGDTYALARDMTREQALAYWCAPGHEVFVAELAAQILGTYYLRPNQKGGGAHVANCGYMTAQDAQGKGVARAMCAHSITHAKARGYRAIQFNIVISSNERAVRLWQDFGFTILATLPEAFLHPTLGYVDAYVMHRSLLKSFAKTGADR